MDHGAFAFVCQMMSLAVALTLDPAAPILMLGLCARLGVIGGPMAWASPFSVFASLPFVLASGTVYLIHTAMDKIPPLGHALDSRA
jgi:hypothetical protein